MILMILSSICRNKRLECYVDGRNVLGWPIRNIIKGYENIRKITVGQGDDYATGCLLYYP